MKAATRVRLKQNIYNLFGIVTCTAEGISQFSVSTLSFCIKSAEETVLNTKLFLVIYVHLILCDHYQNDFDKQCTYVKQININQLNSVKIITIHSKAG